MLNIIMQSSSRNLPYETENLYLILVILLVTEIGSWGMDGHVIDFNTKTKLIKEVKTRQYSWFSITQTHL